MNYGLIQSNIKDNLESFLDIGAHFGDFTKQMLNVFPKAYYYMIEANPICENFLKRVDEERYLIEVLSDKEKEVDFFTSKVDPTSTGSSYYLELTHHFSENNREKTVRKTATLDNLFPQQSFDLIKLDTQGSEIDILKGGVSLVSRASSVVMEVSISRYNKDAPLSPEVDDYMESIGFKNQILIEGHFLDGSLLQEDRLYLR